jgi:hypothetical protein
MKLTAIYGFIAVFFLSFSAGAQKQDRKILAKTILADARLDSIQKKALKLLDGLLLSPNPHDNRSVKRTFPILLINSGISCGTK